SIVEMNVCDSPNKNFKMDQKPQTTFTKMRRKNGPLETAYKVTTQNQPANVYCGERFIPKRFHRDNIDFNLKYIGEQEERDILEAGITATASYWLQSGFASTMNSMFNLKEHRLLQFNNQPGIQTWADSSGTAGSDWPCEPRTRPYSIQNATHEMPEIHYPMAQNLMDWSATNQVALSSGRDIMLWRNLDETTMIYKVPSPTALKFSPDGKYLAIGCLYCSYTVLNFWEIISDMEFLVTFQRYFPKSMGHISCLEWSLDGDAVYCGTHSGVIIDVTYPDMYYGKIREHRHQVTKIQFAPGGKYFASSDTNDFIFIFDAASKKRLLKLCCKNVVFDWHPWTGEDMVVAERRPASIFLFNVSSRKFVASYRRKDKRIIIKTVTFNKITGELLVNIIRKENADLICEILVLASLNRVVDLISHQSRGTLFLMWSPDGTNLATGGMDETFSIWNFIPTHKRYAMLRNRRNSKEKATNGDLSLYKGIR
ncbi:hypothetical protein KR018_001767, partial [Drosophila ironensis]